MFRTRTRYRIDSGMGRRCFEKNIKKGLRLHDDGVGPPTNHGTKFPSDNFFSKTIACKGFKGVMSDRNDRIKPTPSASLPACPVHSLTA